MGEVARGQPGGPVAQEQAEQLQPRGLVQRAQGVHRRALFHSSRILEQWNRSQGRHEGMLPGMADSWLLYGANVYTRELIARRAVAAEEHGLPDRSHPVAGRSPA